jgi:hypothetical protein
VRFHSSLSIEPPKRKKKSWLGSCVKFKIYRSTKNACWSGRSLPNPLIENLARCKKTLLAHWYKSGSGLDFKSGMFAAPFLFLLRKSMVDTMEWCCEKKTISTWSGFQKGSQRPPNVPSLLLSFLKTCEWVRKDLLKDGMSLCCGV